MEEPVEPVADIPPPGCPGGNLQNIYKRQEQSDIPSIKQSASQLSMCNRTK